MPGGTDYCSKCGKRFKADKLAGHEAKCKGSGFMPRPGSKK